MFNTMEKYTHLPNIKDGLIINAINGTNRFQTFIESCLIRVEHGTEKIAYLCTSCRSENVDPEMGPNGVLISKRFADVAYAQTWKGSFVIRSGPGLYHPFRKKSAEGLHYQKCIEGQGIIHAPKVPVNYLTFSDLFEILQSDINGRDNFIYMAISWKMQNSFYVVVCPCRYLNFPHPDQNCRPYIQPISGKVLIERNDRFHKAYVVSLLTRDDKPIRTELCLEQSISVFDAKKGVANRAVALIKFLTFPFREYFLTDEYSEIIQIEAESHFFHY